MIRSVSKVTEVFYSLRGEPIEVHPGFCVDDSVVSSLNLPILAKADPLEELLLKKPDSIIAFCRGYALGDILVLTPLMNSVKEMYPESKIIFVTVEGYLDVFKYWKIVTSMTKKQIPFKKYDVGYYLDRIVEKDHAGDEHSYMHRLDIYCKYVGWPVPKEPRFSLPYGEKEKAYAERIIGAFREPGKPVVVMQLSGAMWFNRFPLGKVMKIAGELASTCSVLMVHNFREKLDVKGVTNLAGQTSIHEVAALIDNADLAVTMDSGLLWVAHCTKTPIIAMFGHTRAKEKMAHHRNYHAIDLAGMVGCESCFGRQTKCGGKANCLNESDTDKIVEEIRNGIKKLVFS